MNSAKQLAKHFREVFFGGNWTCSNVKDQLAGVTFLQATTPIYSLNTIAMLVYHINYYISAATQVLRGAPLNAHDKFSFDLPTIHSQKDWESLINKVFSDAQTFVDIVAQLPESMLFETFAEEKYGNYYRNVLGIIEHTHYHLGQIVLIKKILVDRAK